MKIYKVSKKSLKWKEINQVTYNWKLPILVNHKREVVVGNSLYNILPEEIIICVIEKNNDLEENLKYIEEKVVEENSEERIRLIEYELKEYFHELRKPIIEQLTLFETIRCYDCVSIDNYRAPNQEITYAHGLKQEIEKEYQIYLFEEEKEKIEKDDIEIDMEILKELL